MQTLVNIEGVVERILEKLVEERYYNNKSEAIRAGILDLGHKWKIEQKIKRKKWLKSSEKEIELAVIKMREVDKGIKAGKRKTIPYEEVAKKVEP